MIKLFLLFFIPQVIFCEEIEEKFTTALMYNRGSDIFGAKVLYRISSSFEVGLNLFSSEKKHYIKKHEFNSIFNGAFAVKDKSQRDDIGWFNLSYYPSKYGFYLGTQAGFFNENRSNKEVMITNLNENPGIFYLSQSNRNTVSPLIGAHIGYIFRSRSGIVLGIEAFYGYSKEKPTNHNSVFYPSETSEFNLLMNYLRKDDFGSNRFTSIYIYAGVSF